MFLLRKVQLLSSLQTTLSVQYHIHSRCYYLHTVHRKRELSISSFQRYRYFVNWLTIYKTGSDKVREAIAERSHSTKRFGIVKWALSSERVQVCIYLSPLELHNNQPQSSTMYIIPSLCQYVEISTALCLQRYLAWIVESASLYCILCLLFGHSHAPFGFSLSK
jgi:hypothetical protein